MGGSPWIAKRDEEVKQVAELERIKQQGEEDYTENVPCIHGQVGNHPHRNDSYHDFYHRPMSNDRVRYNSTGW